jgi:acetyl-CoA C-acetyltransferase
MSSEKYNPIPVIIGAGQINDRDEQGKASSNLDSLGLMEAALRAADLDAGGGWLRRLDSLGVVDQISYPELGDLSAPLAKRVDAAPRICYKSGYASGDSPLLLLNEAANRIGAGEIEVAAIAGGEALRTAARRAAATAAGGASAVGASAVGASAVGASAENAVRAVALRRGPSYRHRYGLVAPVDVYPLYENAGRAAYGQTLAQGQAESAAIWSRFSEVAEDNPGAWLRRRVSADDIKTVSAANRPIAFPYSKLMVANSSVNQGAAFIVTSLTEARARGISEDRMIFVGRGAAAHEPIDLMARANYAESPSMIVSIRKALELNALVTADLDYVELYSCFPCVPKMARRVIGWPMERAASVFGGLTFGGGPVGNYMSHAVVSLVLALRQSGRHGLLFANGGLATHNHSIVLSRAPPAANSFPQDFDFQAEADSLRGPAPRVQEDYLGAATVETYTVLYDREGAVQQGAIIGRAPNGARFIAKVPAADAATIHWLTSGEQEPVGMPGTAVQGADGDTWWVRSLS